MCIRDSARLSAKGSVEVNEAPHRANHAIVALIKGGLARFVAVLAGLCSSSRRTRATRLYEHAFVADEATILHADADAFFASVEQRDHPRLRGRPVIVGPGVVMAASYEARVCGVRSAMGGARARRLCPQAIVVEPRFSADVEASRALFEVFDDAAPHRFGVRHAAGGPPSALRPRQR